jgi:hypothetical protein
LIIKFIIVIIVVGGALANLLAVGIESSHDLFHVHIHRCVIKHIVVIVDRPGMTAQTLRIGFIAVVEFTFAKSLPIFVFKNLRSVFG